MTLTHSSKTKDVGEAVGIAETAAHHGRQRQLVYARHREMHRALLQAVGQPGGFDPSKDPGRSRELLWHAFAFLDGGSDGEGEDVALANRVIAQFPDVANHFNPVTAAALLLNERDRLTEDAANVLRGIVAHRCAEAIDYGLAVTGVTNFSSMFAFLLVAASELIDTYPPAFDDAAIPEAYNRTRLQRCGLNMLQLMHLQLQRDGQSQEFNSPTYSPITLWGLAQIVRWTTCNDTRALALELEHCVWSELLALHHPRLQRSAGPHSRAYLVDHVGHGTNWKILCAALGIDTDRTAIEWLYDPRPGDITSGDRTFRQAIACWLLRADYHVPHDVLNDLQQRVFPYQYTADYQWAGKGFRAADGRVILNVDGDQMTPGGRGTVYCYQAAAHALASMNATYTPLNQPCALTYALDDSNHHTNQVRRATLVMLTEPLASAVDVVALRNHGAFELQQESGMVRGRVHPYAWLPMTITRTTATTKTAAAARTDDPIDISLDLLFSEHGVPHVAEAQIDDTNFNGDRIQTRGRRGRFVIRDGAVAIVWSICVANDATFVIHREHGWLRCSVVLYHGQLADLQQDDLVALHVDFELMVTGVSDHATSGASS